MGTLQSGPLCVVLIFFCGVKGYSSSPTTIIFTSYESQYTPVNEKVKVGSVCGSNFLSSNDGQGSNLALNKPAYQSSDYPSNAAADNAVDGNTNPNWSSGSCSHTAESGDTSPWWMVDLLGLYDITNVTLWNRENNQERLSNLVIEVSSENPSLCSTPNIKQCATYPGTLGAVETLTCAPSVMGRFLKISKDTSMLTLCEVDIRGNAIIQGCAQTIFMRQEAKRYQVSGVNSLTTFGTPSECGSDCRRYNCIGFNYKSSLETCEMILSRESSDQLIDSVEWNYYGNDIC